MWTNEYLFNNIYIIIPITQTLKLILCFILALSHPLGLVYILI